MASKRKAPVAAARDREITGDAAFAAHLRDIAERNERAQKAARKVRGVRERERIRQRRRDDLI